MQFRILGPLEVADGGRLIALGGAKQRALLAILLLNANEVVSSDRLIDELWGEHTPESGRAALQVRVSQLRKALGPAAAQLLTRAPGYVLRLERDNVDLQRFERLVGEADTAEPAEVAVKLREALELWRGPALGDLAYESFAQTAIRRLEELRLATLEKRIDADLALGRHSDLVAELEKLVAEHPLRERLRGQLMLALYRAGRQPDALAVYRRARAHLSEELGLEPGPELKALQTAILNQDPGLTTLPSARGGPVEVPVGDIGDVVGSDQADISRWEGAVLERDSGPPPEDVASPARARQARKVVTALFCDVTDSTALGEELDPEVLSGVMSRYFEELRATIERHGGTVAKFIGDSVMAVFGIPRLHEDDALRAVRAAAEIRRRLPAVAEHAGVALRFRTGINTGLVLVGDGENLAIGDAVNVAARLEQAAQPGEILLGRATLRLVRDAVDVEPLEPLVLKGKSEPVPAFRLLDVDPVAPGIARRFDVALVGRERELRLLREAWDRAVAESGCHLFTLLGAAGVGKSRLVAELLAGIGDKASVLRGRCLHYGEGITFWPLVEALTPAGETAHGVLEHLGGGAAAPAELFWEVRRLLESLATERPVILHLDDLQWGEPMLLDLLDHVVDLSRGAPILLLCAARPELLEDRTSWGGGKLNATTVLLEPLATDECEVLLEQLGDGLDPDLHARVVATSEGNPLFLEEMAALAHERGSVAVPPTIQALLAARLERLTPEERELLERAAVEGEVFHRLAMHALAGEGLTAEVDSGLAGLVRKELIRPHAETIRNDQAFRFRHLLIRDAAYDGMPKATRGGLHERFARWLEDRTQDLLELDEIAGWHLEQTIKYQRELARDVDPAVVQDAVRHLHAAGLRASERHDVAAARNLLERARALEPEENALRARISIDLADQLIDSGELTLADQLLSSVEGDPDTRALASLARLEWLVFAKPHEATLTIESTLPDILAQFSRAGDENDIAKAHMAADSVHKLAGRWTSAAEQAWLAAEHARMAGNEGLRSRALSSYLVSIMYGRQRTQAIAQELETIEREKPGPYIAAYLNRGHGEVARLDGRFSDARRLLHRATEGFQSLGLLERVASCEQDLAWTEFSAGDAAAALAAILRSDAILAELGSAPQRATGQALLAQAYELLGSRDAARAAIEFAEEIGAAEDVITYGITHRVRARLALAEGHDDAAERCARSAVDRTSRTDDIVMLADATLDLARVLSALERPKEATAHARAALDLCVAKGYRPAADEARALLDELGRNAGPARPAGHRSQQAARQGRSGSADRA